MTARPAFSSWNSPFERVADTGVFFSTAPLSISSSCEQATKVYQHHTYILFVRQEIALQAKQVPREREEQKVVKSVRNTPQREFSEKMFLPSGLD
jgi:hypothetical protein